MIRFKINDTVIYHLLLDGVVVYVGKTTSVINRLKSHKGQNEKKYDEVEFFSVSGDDVDFTEFAEILEHQPIYNKVLPTFGFALYKSDITKINSALSLGNIEHKGYLIDNPTMTVTLNGKSFHLWSKKGKDKEFSEFRSFVSDYSNQLESMCLGLEDKLNG